MKLADRARDLFGLDPRARGFGKDLADTPSSSIAQFADVLSDFGSAVEADGSVDPRGGKPFASVAVTLGQVDPGITAASAILPSADQDVNDGQQSKCQAAVRNDVATTVGANLEEFAIGAALVPTPSQSTPTRGLARSVDSLRHLDAAPDAVQSPGDPRIMIPNNPSASKPSTVQPGEPSRRPPGAKQPYEVVATQLETTGATSSKIDRDLAPTSAETRLTSEGSAESDRQPEPRELMALLFGGLNDAHARFAQTPPPETVSGANSIDAVVIEASEATDISSSPPRVAASSEALPGSVAAADPPAIPAAEGLSVLSISAHLAPSSNRATSPLNSKTRSVSTMPQNSVGNAGIEETHSENSGPAAASPVSDTQALTSGALGDTPAADGASRLPTNSESPTRLRAKADSTRFEPSLHAGDVDHETPIDQSAGVKAAQRTHDIQGGEPAVRDRDPSQPSEVSPPESPWPMQGSRPIDKIAAAVTKLAEPAAASPASSPMSVAPARTLTLRLEQAGLGPIDIRMHVSGATLDLHLTVADHETLTILQRNRETLTSAIADRQYQVHSLTIQDSSAASTSVTNSTGQGDPGASTGTRVDTDAQASGNQRGDQSNGHRGSSSYRQDEKPAPSRPRDPRRGSLFV